MKYKLLILSLLFLPYTTKADKIALTFDDLPSQQEEEPSIQYEINQDILTALAKHMVSAVGFVNEIKIYRDKDNSDERIKTLKLWVSAGHELGNHTYSHYFLSQTDLKKFEEDVVKGSGVSKQIMIAAGKEYKYFRHPYLDTGGSIEKRTAFENFLKQEGYIIAPITVDIDDWEFDRELLKRPQDKDKIIKAYLKYAKARLDFYALASGKIFGRNISQTLLLHVNLLNAYALDDLLKLIEKSGYNFISLDEAMQDPAYSEEDKYYGAAGVSWFYRWQYTRGLRIVNWSHEPKIEDYLPKYK